MIYHPRLLLRILATAAVFACTRSWTQEPKQLPAPASPGTAIESAAKATVPNYRQFGAVDILTDTEGVDFAPYLKPLLSRVREEWYAHIPEPVQRRAGKLAIEFTIDRDGHISDMELVATSGDVMLDRPAWDAIRSSNPFPKLPEGFHGAKLVLRCRFYYNPGNADLTHYTWPSTQDLMQHAVLKQKTADSNAPKFPKEALDKSSDGVVRLEIKVGTDGKVINIKPIEGDPTLAESAMRAIQNWRFHPARLEGKKVEDILRVNVEFRLQGQLVRSQVVWPEAPALPSPE